MKRFLVLLFIAGTVFAQQSVTSKKIYASRFGSRTSGTLNTILGEFSTETVHIVLNAGQWSITNNVTFPTNATLEFETGSSINIDAGDTFTINGYLISGDQRIFYGTGTLAGSPSMLYRWPSWGATGTYDIGTGDLPDSSATTLEDTLGNGNNAAGNSITNVGTVQGTNGNFEVINAGTLNATSPVTFTVAQTNDDLTVNGDFFVNSNDMAVSYRGYPKLTLTTNMVDAESSGGTFIPVTAFTNAFDGSYATRTVHAVMDNTYHHYDIDLGDLYEGYQVVTVTQTNAGQDYLSIGYSVHKPQLSGSRVQNGGTFTWAQNGGTANMGMQPVSGTVSGTNTVTQPFVGRYLQFNNLGAAASVDYTIVEWSVYATTNSFRNMTGQP